VAPSPAATPEPTGPLAASGTVALLSGDTASLALVDASGATVLAAEADAGAFGFPVWSPDGSHIAITREDATGRAIVVIDPTLKPDAPGAQTVVFESASIQPFYVSWQPDSKAVSFLATEAGGLSLRLATVDGSAPAGGSDTSTVVREGNPFYYDWIGADRLLAHIGTGPEAFLGEIGIDGEGTGGALGTPGDFRTPVISHDQAFEGVVRGGDAAADGSVGPGSIVLAERGGDAEQSMPVFGPAALAFDPTGSRLAAIGAVEAIPGAPAIPLGPIRFLEPDGDGPRTLLEGPVVAFWWSPDGSTIAAIRVTSVDGAPEIRLVFIDVAKGEIRSQPLVRPSQVFINQLLTYFDQYALSHRLWAPDSSSFLLPVAEDGGATRVLAVTPDGTVLARLDGTIGFWSP
jgi:TolB protein